MVTGHRLLWSARVHEALLFATHAHMGQVRRYVGTPYVGHPVAVAKLLRYFIHDESMLMAALLHDVVNDCGVSVADVCKIFGDDVAYLVGDVSDVSQGLAGSRHERKAADVRHLAVGSPRAKTIKACDVICNVRTIVQHDRRFAKVYLPEKAQELVALREASDPRAHLLATRMVSKATAKLQAAGNHHHG